MTKKDFYALAHWIAQIPSSQSRIDATLAVSLTAMDTNPRFDVTRFQIACGLRNKDGDILAQRDK